MRPRSTIVAAYVLCAAAGLRGELELTALTQGFVEAGSTTVEPERVGLWLRPVEADVR